MTGARDPWARLVELAVYAPIGLATAIREDLPKLVQDGKQRVENRIQIARWLGQMAVQQLQREAGKRLADRAAADAAAAAAAAEQLVLDVALDVAVDTVDTPVDTPVDMVGLEPTPAGVSPDAPAIVAVSAATAPSAVHLPIEGYESLAALHVVQRLAGLSDSELETVRRFEAANRARRTILAKVAQLQGD